jgi:predicted nucleotidyltransferase
MSEPVHSLDEIKSTVSDAARHYGVKRVALFGSYARGDATNKSDIDLCIEPGEIRSLIGLSGFRIEIVERLQTDVDIVTSDCLDKKFLQRIQREEVLLYGIRNNMMEYPGRQSRACAM